MSKYIDRVKSIKNYRAFENFKWSLTYEFGKINLIYGLNGSGKSTLANLFRCVATGETLDPKCSFKLQLNNNQVIVTEKNYDDLKLPIYVYNREYVQETVGSPLGHIYILGKAEKEQQEEIVKLEEDIKNTRSKKEELDGTQRSILKNITKTKSSFASEIKQLLSHVTGYINYNKTSLEKTEEMIRKNGISNYDRLSDQEINDCIALTFEDEKQLIGESYTISLQLDEYIQKILEVLSSTPSNLAIEELTKDPEINAWAAKGLEIHIDRDIKKCQFCGQEVTKERLELLMKHFDDSYKKIVDQLDSCIDDTDFAINQLNEIIAPVKEQFYRNQQKQYLKASKEFTEKRDNAIKIFLSIREILINKKNNIVDNNIDILKDNVDRFDININDCELIALIKENNRLTRELTKEKKAKAKRVEISYVLKYIDEISEPSIQFENNEITLKNCNETIEKNTERLKQLDVQKDYHKYAEYLDEGLHRFLGRNDLRIEADEKGYRIFRGEEEADNLSEGENNAIALIYFFMQFESQERDLKSEDCILIIDDPFSSFDNNSFYASIGYIAEKAIKFNQIFIFSHQLYFLKRLRTAWKKEENKVCFLQITNKTRITIDELDPLLKKYDTEYYYYFKEIYNFTKKLEDAESGQETIDLNQHLYMPNLARKLLDSYLNFKVPDLKNDIAKKYRELCSSSQESCAIITFLNDMSHGNPVDLESKMRDFDWLYEGRGIFREILDLIKEHDPLQYKGLVQIIYPPIKEEEPVYLKHYAQKPAAGDGNCLIGDDYEMIELKKKKIEEKCNINKIDKYFVVSIQGDSMEPFVKNGDMIICEEIEAKAIELVKNKGSVIISIGESCYFKILKHLDGKYFLHSRNEAYSDIEVEDDNYRLIGRYILTYK